METFGNIWKRNSAQKISVNYVTLDAVTNKWENIY